MQVSRLVFPCQNSYNGIEIEIFSDGSTNWVYLNLHGCPLAYDEESLFEIGQAGDVVLEGIILQGGQKILLTDPSAEALIEAINCDLPISLSISNYSFTTENTEYTEYTEYTESQF